MKNAKLIIPLILISLLTILGCGDSPNIQEITYPPYRCFYFWAYSEGKLYYPDPNFPNNQIEKNVHPYMKNMTIASIYRLPADIVCEISWTCEADCWYIENQRVKRSSEKGSHSLICPGSVITD